MGGRHAAFAPDFSPLDEESQKLTRRWLVLVRPNSGTGWLGIGSFDHEIEANANWAHQVRSGKICIVRDQFKQEGN